MASIIRVQIGRVYGEKFKDYLEQSLPEQLREGEITLSLDHKTGPKPGFALDIPPEVLIAVASGAASKLGAGLGQLIWEKLREFFKQQPPAPTQRPPLFIIIDGRKIIFDPSKMPMEIPSDKGE